MNSILYSILISLLLRMSIITGFILLIKAVFHQKLSALLHNAIWLILVMQFIFCIFNIRIPAGASIYNYIQPETEAIQAAARTAVSGGFDIKSAAAFIWFFSGIILFAWYISVYIRHRISLRALERITDSETLMMLDDIRTQLGISDNIILCRGDTAQTTANIIILPDMMPKDELRQVLLHEMCHYKNRDCKKLWAAIVIISFNWFNPIIWYAFKRFRTDVEMLCDDMVLKYTDNKKCYATALVHSSMAKGRFIPGTTSLHNGKNEVSRRVKRLVSWKKKKPVWAIMAMCVCVAVSCLCLTDAVTVAVENNVDIAETPRPIQRNTPSPAPQATKTPVRYESTTQSTPTEVYTSGNAEMPVYEEPEAKSITDVNIDEASRDDIYNTLGEPSSVSLNGTKETYQLEDGTTAIVQYSNDTIEYGYIVEGALENQSEASADTDG